MAITIINYKKKRDSTSLTFTKQTDSSITQTNTDTDDFDGLVTALDNDSKIFPTGKTIQDIFLQIPKLKIDGTCSFTVPRAKSLQMFIGDDTFTSKELTNNGTLTVQGNKVTINNEDISAYNTSLFCMRESNSSFAQTEGAIYNNGTMNLSDLLLYIANPIDWFSVSSGVINLNRVWVLPYDRSAASVNNQINAQIRYRQLGDFNDVILSTRINFFNFPRYVQRPYLLNIGGLADIFIQSLESAGVSSECTISGAKFSGSAQIAIIGSARLDCLNFETGSQSTLSLAGAGSQLNSGIPLDQDMQVELKLSDGTAAEHARVRMKEYDSGVRPTKFYYCTINSPRTYAIWRDNLDTQKVYTFTVSSTGKSQTEKIRLVNAWKNNSASLIYRSDISAGNKKDYRMKSNLDDNTLYVSCYGYTTDPIPVVVRAHDTTYLVNRVLVKDPKFIHIREQVGYFNGFHTTTRLFEGIKLQEEINNTTAELDGIENSLVSYEGDTLIIRDGWNLNFTSGNGALSFNGTTKTITVPIENNVFTFHTDDNFTKLIVNGNITVQSGLLIQGIYQYIDSNGKTITSHHIYPTTDEEVITNSNRQNIHIHGKTPTFQKFNDVNGVQLEVLETDEGYIVTTVSYNTDDIEVGAYISTSGEGDSPRYKVTEVPNNATDDFFEISGNVAEINEGDLLWISHPGDETDNNLLELENQTGQIDYYFEYEQDKYFEILIDIFGDINRSSNTYALLPDEITPIIEKITGTAEIDAWRTERAAGTTATITVDTITPSGTWSDHKPEQLLWNIRESVTEYNKANPGNTRNVTDYYTTNGSSIIFQKELTTLAGFTASSIIEYDKITYVDANESLLAIIINMQVQTATKFGLIINNVQAGDNIGYLTGTTTTQKLLVSSDISVNEQTILVLELSKTYKLRVRRKGFNESLINISSTIRTVIAQFLAIPSYEFSNAFTDVISDYLAWSNNKIQFKQSNIVSADSLLDMITEFNHTFPQGIDAEPLINTYYGYDDDIITLNYETIVIGIITTITIPAIYTALAFYTGRAANGDPILTYLKLRGNDSTNDNSGEMTWDDINKDNFSMTDKTSEMVYAANLTEIETYTGAYGSETVDTATATTLTITTNNGTSLDVSSVSSDIPYNQDRGLYKQTQAGETNTYTVYPEITVGAQIQSLINNEIVIKDSHINWGAIKTGGYNEDDRVKATDIKSETNKIQSIKDETEKITSIKTEANKIPSILSETSKIQSIKDQTDTITERTKLAADYFNPSSDTVDIGKVKGVNVTNIDDFKASPTDLSITNTKIDSVKIITDAIKIKSDKLQFTTNNDIKSTLDGEQVTTDDPSREASKAVISYPDFWNVIVDNVIDNSFGKLIKDNVNYPIGDIPSVSEIKAALIDDTDGYPLLQAIKDKIGNINVTAAQIALEVWNTLTTGTLTNNSILRLITDNLDEKISEIKTETDKLVNIKVETDKIQSIKDETNKISDVKVQTDKINDIKSETNKIQSIKDESDKISSIKITLDQVQAIVYRMKQYYSEAEIKLTVESVTEEIKIVTVYTDNTRSTILEKLELKFDKSTKVKSQRVLPNV